MKKNFFISMTIVLAFVNSLSSASSSQIPNHIRNALLALKDNSTPANVYINSILKKNLNYYFAGAAGPDVLYVMDGAAEYANKPLPVNLFSRMAHHAHDFRTGNLIRNMLRIAMDEQDSVLRERYLAYVLGWITHYFVDGFEHQLVNRYGGYYEAGGQPRHDTLEMFEAGHVLEMAGPKKVQQYKLERHSVPIIFVVKAFRSTYRDPSEIQGLWRFNILDVASAQRIVDHHTHNLVYEYQNQIHRNLGQAIRGRIPTSLRTGHIPLRQTYQKAIFPLGVKVQQHGISPLILKNDGRMFFNAEIEWHIFDETMLVSYISDWYGVNDKALDRIVKTFRSIGVDLMNSTDVPLRLPDFNFDAGILENNDIDLYRQGLKRVEEISRAFKPIDKMELTWRLIDSYGHPGSPEKILIDVGSGSEIEGLDTRFNRGREGITVFNVSLPQSFVEKNSVSFKIEVSLKMLHHNYQKDKLGMGKYVSSYRFKISDSGVGIVLPDRQRYPIEARDEMTILPQTMDWFEESIPTLQVHIKPSVKPGVIRPY